MRGTTHMVRLPLALPAQAASRWRDSARAFAWGMRSIASTVLTLVLFATYLGIGALAHDSHFSLGWALASTLFVWPAQRRSS
jgi:isopenicillin N synthase-like dioxygenase